MNVSKGGPKVHSLQHSADTCQQQVLAGRADTGDICNSRACTWSGTLLLHAWKLQQCGPTDAHAIQQLAWGGDPVSGYVFGVQELLVAELVVISRHATDNRQQPRAFLVILERRESHSTSLGMSIGTCLCN